MMFAGIKGASYEGPYKPLNHVVEFDFDSNALHGGRERVNATYFVRRYDEGSSDANRDVASSVLQFQHWNRIIMQSEMYHRPPRPPRTTAAVCDAPRFDAEEEFIANDFLDWNSDGLPLECQHRGSRSCWVGVWQRVAAPFLRIFWS